MGIRYFSTMIRIDFQVRDRTDAAQALRRAYEGCVLVDRDYGFDMLIPGRREIGANVTIAAPGSTAAAMVVLRTPA
jgi:hypothetical protein